MIADQTTKAATFPWPDSRPGVQVLSAQDWQAIQETLCLLAVPGKRESIKEGMAEPLAQSKSELDW